MNESIKTLIFVAVAAVAMGVGGTVNWYRPSVQDDESLGTGPLFADFTDPGKRQGDGDHRVRPGHGHGASV